MTSNLSWTTASSNYSKINFTNGEPEGNSCKESSIITWKPNERNEKNSIGALKCERNSRKKRAICVGSPCDAPSDLPSNILETIIIIIII